MIEFLSQNWRFGAALLVVLGSMGLAALAVALLFVRPERLARRAEAERHAEELARERERVARLAAWQVEESTARRARATAPEPCFCRRDTVRP